MRVLRKTLHVLAILVAASAGAADTDGPPADAVATIGGKPITAVEFDQVLGDRLLAMRTEEFNAKVRILHDMIGERLLAQEAAARGTTVEALLRAEVQGKVTPVTEAEVNAAYESVKERQKNAPEAEVKKRIEENLRRQREQARRGQFLRELRDKASVRILIEPPRASVADKGDAPSKGPSTAPVTVVEFSDFQCPYCGRVLPTLKRVQETYGDRVRLVFRNYPLSIHPFAPKAAEAAACAQEQGKFWEMHDRLFGDQQKLQVADLKASAAAIGLDTGAFDQCLDSGKHEPTWKEDLAEGERYGVSGTPAVFVNGRLIGGAQPYESFAQVIDDELERKGIAKGK
jgi:protein-disulfide isomerase